MRDIDCPPYAPILMSSTRAIGYSIEAAIADIIDNSIAAYASKVEITFWAQSNPYIAILDDGKGINSNDLTEAMRYGSSNPLDERDESDLGRYGLGLKTASLSQCRCLKIISNNGDCLVGRQWDLDHILKTQKWSLQELNLEEIDFVEEIDKLKEQKTGTLVVWNELDKIKSGSTSFEKLLEHKMNDVKKHLELVFHRFLSGEGKRKMTISINGINLIPFDPFFASKSMIIMDDEKIEIPGRDGKVTIRPYILPHPSKMTKLELEKYGGKDGLRRLQGFYIYRNKRLLTWGTWFKLVRLDEFSKLARVRVDIPNSLDDLWTLDIKKSAAYPPELVKTRLKQLVGNISNSSKKTWTFRQKKEVIDTVVHVWEKSESREGIKYSVNLEHPILENINSKLDSESRELLKNYLETIQNNLPFNNLHFDMHTDVKILQDNDKIECKRISSLARQMLKESKGNGNIEDMLERIRTVEPFTEYMDEILKIYEEVRIDG